MKLAPIKWPLILIACLGLAIAAVLNDPRLPEWFSGILEPARNFYGRSPFWAILIFCLAHLVASLFSIPGGCTGLNVLAGAIFGFAAGCAIVYPITMLSAALAYLAGERIGRSRIFERYRISSQSWLKRIDQHDYWFLVGLRLSPLLPFGTLNLLMGALKVPWVTYLSTTCAGIFFDVTLLNGIGAGLFHSRDQGIEKLLLLCAFAILIAATYSWRTFRQPAEDAR